VSDALQGSGEVFEVGDAVLKEIADPGCRLGEQARRDSDLDVLGEDQDPHLGIAAPDLRCGTEPFVGVRRWHPDVDDRDVRPVTADLPQ
jgi:hypothetical protein